MSGMGFFLSFFYCRECITVKNSLHLGELQMKQQLALVPLIPPWTSVYWALTKHNSGMSWYQQRHSYRYLLIPLNKKTELVIAF